MKLQLKANRRTAEYRISNVEGWNRSRSAGACAACWDLFEIWYLVLGIFMIFVKRVNFANLIPYLLKVTCRPLSKVIPIFLLLQARLGNPALQLLLLPADGIE